MFHKQGFNFQIWSVLLSLGVLTKLEFDLRDELSKIFNSCVHVRRCLHTDITPQENGVSRWHFFKKSESKECASKWKHKNTPYNNILVVVANLLFSLLAVAHLSYLGSTFDGKQEVTTLTLDIYYTDCPRRNYHSVDGVHSKLHSFASLTICSSVFCDSLYNSLYTCFKPGFLLIIVS